MTPLERLARVHTQGFHTLTVYTEHEDMVAFKYDDGGYGWAQRSSFVPLEEAERAQAEAKERAERARLDENLRAILRIDKELAQVERERQRLLVHREHYERKMEAPCQD